MTAPHITDEEREAFTRWVAEVRSTPTRGAAPRTDLQWWLAGYRAAKATNAAP